MIIGGRKYKISINVNHQCKIQLLKEWLLEVNDASSPITRFKESKILSELIRNTNNDLKELEKWCKHGLHLCATEKMFPWFHAYDHFNYYARHYTYCALSRILRIHILGCARLTLINILV